MQQTLPPLSKSLKKLSLTILISTISFTGSELLAQTVNCSRPEQIADRFICNDNDLKQIDQQIQELFTKNNSNLLPKLHAQFQEDRNNCTNKDCVLESLNAEKNLYQDLSTPFSLDKNKSRESYKNTLKQRTDEQKIYTVRDEPWQRITLTEFDNSVYIALHDVIYKDGILYAYISDSNSIYEYSDAQKQVSKIFEITDSSKYIHIQPSLTGIEDNYFYFRIKYAKNLDASYRYALGSNLPVEPSPIVYAGNELGVIDAWADITQNEKITLRYYGKDNKHVYEIAVAEALDDGEDTLAAWYISNFVWNPYVPALYFDNEGTMACIWRSDMITHETVKIVPEHEAIQPRPIYIGSREAVVYIENNALKIAFAPTVKNK